MKGCNSIGETRDNKPFLTDLVKKQTKPENGEIN
jgi:hypothetical protein